MNLLFVLIHANKQWLLNTVPKSISKSLAQALFGYIGQVYLQILTFECFILHTVIILSQCMLCAGINFKIYRTGVLKG